MAKRKRADVGKDSSLAAGSAPAKSKGSSEPLTSPESHPSLPLILLVHTFLQNNHYDKATRALTKESQFQSASTSFDGATQGLPDLAELYSFWAKQHKPDHNNSKSQESRSSAEAGASDDEESDTSRDEDTDGKDSAENDPRTESESDSESDSEESSSSSVEGSEVDKVTSSKTLKDSEATKKRSQPPSSSSNSFSESASSSESSSESESHSADEEAPTKKRKLVEADKQILAGTDDQASSSESTSDSGDESDGSASTSGKSVSGSSSLSEQEQDEKASDEDSRSETSTSDSDSDSDSNSNKSSEDESDSLPDSQRVPPKVEANPSRTTLGRYASDSAASASSSTLKGSPVKSTEPPELSDMRPPKRKREDPPATSPSFSNPQKLNKHDKQPFSRVPKDTQVDPRFASNKYVPYDYADRAYQDLSVTKGKGFTKEKNKKKRGSYRGGAIDTTPKGIKFDD
ncbi:MAG: hypothetical protein Q9165_004737 [Trypethelium subeluteriae]